MFYGVYNYKQAVLQEMQAQGWDAAWDPSFDEPGITDVEAWSMYFKWLYYKSFYNMAQVEPVLVPISSAKRQFKIMRSLITAEDPDDISDSDIDNSFSPFYELISSTTKLIGETAGDAVIGIGSRLTNELNDSFDNNTEGYDLCVYNNSTYGWHSTSNKETFFNYTFRGHLGGQRKSVPFGELVKSSEDYMKYTDNDGKEQKSRAIIWKTTPNYGGDIDSVPVDNYLFKGKSVPRTRDTNRIYLLYMKFEENIPDQLLPVYHYYPLTPFMSYDNEGYFNRYGYDELTYAPNKGLPFSFQPFNYQPVRDEHFIAGNAIALPPIAFCTNGQLPVLQYNGSTEYWYSMVVIPEDALKQYFYLINVPVALGNQDGGLTPFADLYKGEAPTVADPGGGGSGESGGGIITPNPGGTTTGGGRGEISSTEQAPDSYPVGQHLLRPGFYGGIYIPTYRYIIELGKDIDSNNEAVNEMNEIISNLTRDGKLDSIVECFITYSGFVNYAGIDSSGNAYDFRYKLPYIPIDVINGRPLFMCGYDSASSNSYIPKNNKLLTYPYVSFEINGYGEKNELKFENWYGAKPQLRIVSKFQPGAGVFLYPKDYDGILDNYDAGVTGQPLPIMSYTKDQYKNEYNACVNSRTAAITSLNENATLGVINATLAAGAGAAVGAATLNPGKVVGSIVQGEQEVSRALLTKHQGLREFEAQLKDVENRPLAIANQNAAPSIPAAMNDSVVPFVVWKSIRKEFAMKIDEFFTRYGYKVNKFKEVNINTRPVFNFLKCSQARVEGSIPNDDLIQIKNILEKGITFWHDTNNILNYNVNNPAPKNDATVYLQPSYKQ